MALASCGPGEAADAGAPDAGRPDAGQRIDAGYDPDAPVACEREVTVRFVPTARLQLAVWAQQDERFATLAMTEATARRGIGNRPGALQMNSGFRWPYGRRENVLPGWAGERLASGARPFGRVVFQAPPGTEGLFSRGGDPIETRDDFFCWTFDASQSRRRALDSVSCADDWPTDKGRYLDAADVEAGYAEPEQAADGARGWRALELTSAYPPRRDMRGTAPEDHPNAARYAADALQAMPELDAITMATPRAERLVEVSWRVPDEWPEGLVTLTVEANQEGDYGPAHGPDLFPTPTEPTEAWDYWAIHYGYPYRGQPSVLFDIDVQLPRADRRAPASVFTSARPTRQGSLDASLATSPVDDSIVDDPEGAPGSGADRLLLQEDGWRVDVVVENVDCR